MAYPSRSDVLVVLAANKFSCARRQYPLQFTNTMTATVLGVFTAAVITGTTTNYVLGIPKER
jgi:hypothetical protein